MSTFTLCLVGVMKERMDGIGKMNGLHPLFGSKSSKILGRMDEKKGLPIHPSPAIYIIPN